MLTDYETMLEKCELIQQDSDDLDWEDNPDVAEDELNEVEDELEALVCYKTLLATVPCYVYS